MFSANQKGPTAAGISATTNASNKGGLVNTQPLLGPTATANVNLGGNANNAGYNNGQAGQQTNPAQYGAWNTQGQFQQTPGGTTYPGNQMSQDAYKNQPGGQSQPLPYQQNPGTQNQIPSYGNQTPATQGQYGQQSGVQNLQAGQSPAGNYPNPQINQTYQPGQQNSSVVQQVPGPGQQTPPGQQNTSGNNSKYYPGQQNPGSKPGNTSTAPTSKNPSTHSQSNHGNTSGQRPVQNREKPNGEKQSGPGLAIGTNFKSSCDSTPKIPYKDKNIVPWDHSKGNFVYREKDFEKLRPHVTVGDVKAVDYM